MKILYITEELLAPDLALRMKLEGNDLYLAMKEESDILKGTLKKIPYESRFEFAKTLDKEADLIVYDDKADGEPAEFRKHGYSVIGGGLKTDEIEKDRVLANKIAKACGMKVPEIHVIKSLKEAKEFLIEEKGKWVLKQMGKLDNIKGLNFVSKMDDSEDLIAYLDWLDERWIKGVKQEFILQEKIEGHEFACGSYWNGKEYQKDKEGDEICEENWEHKPLMAGGMGEATGEMFTVIHYVKAKDSKIFKETIDKLRPALKKIDFRGDFDINCIVNETGVYFLEFTPRMGVPATSAQIAIQKTPWGEFLKAVADGKQVPDYQFNPGYCIVSWLYTKPFPAIQLAGVKKVLENFYEKNTKEEFFGESLDFKLSNSYGMPILFKEKLSKDELDNIHFDGVMMDKEGLKVANPNGYVVTVTGMGETVDLAAERTEHLLKKIVVPKGFFRNDFKKSNYHKSRNDLIDWGFLKEEKDESELDTIKKQIKDVLKK